MGNSYKQKLLLFVVCIFIQYILFIVYKDYISPTNEYMGLVFNSPNTTELTVAVIACALPVFILPSELKAFSSIIMWYLFICSILPFGVVVLVLGTQKTLFTSVLSHYLPSIAIIYLYVYIIKTPKKGIALYNISLNKIRKILLTLTVCTGILLLWKTGMSITFTLDDDYSRRLYSREIISGGSIISYTAANYVKVIVPTVIALGLVRLRDISLILAGLFGGLVLFSIDGTKGSVLLPIVMIGLHLLLRYGNSKPKYLLLFILAIIVFGYYMERSYGSDFINTYVIRRFFFVPQYLMHAHFTYFNEIGYMYFSDLPLIGVLISGTRSESAAIQVGQSFLGTEGLNANVGVIQYGYSEAGILGCWLMSILLIVIIFYFDKATSLQNKSWTLPLSIPVASTLTEQSLHTSILSGGLLGIFILICITNQNNVRNYST